MSLSAGRSAPGRGLALPYTAAMVEGLPPVTPPPTMPPRPDAPERGRGALFVAFVLISVLAVAFSALAVRSLLDEPDGLSSAPVTSPSPSPSATPSASEVSPGPSPSGSPGPVGAFRFMRWVAAGPVRWDPCESITYAINPFGASIDVRPDLREAVRRVGEATGIRFRPAGTTREGFLHAFLRMRYEGAFRGADVIVFWVDHDDYRSIVQRLFGPSLPPSIALGKPMAGLYRHRDQYFGGLILVDADAVSVPGFASPQAHGLVLLHELGHVMGLGHVRDRDQLMYSGRRPNEKVGGFGAGDLEGLRRLGVDAGCLS